MNYLEIKENRKKLKLTQAELAIKLGVSLKTVSNYEKGEVIPETKQELLRNIFSIKSNITLEEPSELYIPNINVEIKVKQVVEKIKEHKKIMQLAAHENEIDLKNHHAEMIELLKEQLNLMTKSNASKLKEEIKYLNK